MTGRPLCECHGIPKIKSGFSRSGNQRWICSIRNKEIGARYRATHLEEERAYGRAYHAAHKTEQNRLRRERGGFMDYYYDRGGYAVKRKRYLSGQRKRALERLEQLQEEAERLVTKP